MPKLSDILGAIDDNCGDMNVARAQLKARYSKWYATAQAQRDIVATKRHYDASPSFGW